MRPQQKSFVVEYKSSRRQTLKQERSIWGNTNFRALAQEAEIDAPQLFEKRSADRTEVDNAHTFSVETEAGGAVVDIQAEDTTVSPIASARNLEEDCLPELLPVGVVGTLEKAMPADPAKTHKRRRSKVSATVKAHGSAPLHVSSQEPTSSHPVSDNELFELEAENRRLRSEFQARLTRENMRLRKMLERF